MPNKIEQEIVQTYIVKNKRKRILWELDNPKKREYILFNRFLGIDNWKKGCLQPVEYLTSEKLSYYLAEKSKKKEVYWTTFYKRCSRKNGNGRMVHDLLWQWLWVFSGRRGMYKTCSLFAS